MSAPHVSPPNAQQAGHVSWLPPVGEQNGLDDSSWAPVADIGRDIVRPVLQALGDAGIAGFAAPIRRASRTYRLWVGVSHYASAEDVLRRVLATAGRATGG